MWSMIAVVWLLSAAAALILVGTELDIPRAQGFGVLLLVVWVLLLPFV